MRLSDLLRSACPEAEKTITSDPQIHGLECDSRKVEPGYLFIAVRGSQKNGGTFIPEAVRRGAVAVVAEEKPEADIGVPFIRVPDSRLAIARLAGAFHGFPARALKTVAITGTNGKTTCSYLIEHFLEAAGQKTGVIGTVNIRFSGTEVLAEETTPGPLRLQTVLARMREAACRFAVMEVSSHAMDQNRVAGIDFNAALFTNLTQDHLDYHGTLEAYFNCKARLFRSLASGATALLNADDARVVSLAGELSARVRTFGLSAKADYRATEIRWTGRATHFRLVYPDGALEVETPLIGGHNVSNVLGSLSVVDALGLDLRQAAVAAASFGGVPGRLEAVEAGQDFLVFVDFAHTPDGLENVLSSLKPYNKGKLTVVFGCGGDRDATKRPKMGAIAARLADRVIVTSDNPRSEDPRAIGAAIKTGFPSHFTHYQVQLDRRKAIRQALLEARTGDIVLLAGKGHERTQIIGAEVLPFSDREEAERVLNGR